MRTHPRWPRRVQVRNNAPKEKLKFARKEVMSLLTHFFKDSDTQLGVFYPRHYLIAVLWNLETAQRTAKKLRRKGFAEDEVIAVAGQDFIKLSDEETGPGGFLMQSLSRFLGNRTEISR